MDAAERAHDARPTPTAASFARDLTFGEHTGHAPRCAGALPRGRRHGRGHPGRRSRLRGRRARHPRGLRERSRLRAERRRRARARGAPTDRSRARAAVLVCTGWSAYPRRRPRATSATCASRASRPRLRACSSSAASPASASTRSASTPAQLDRLRRAPHHAAGRPLAPRRARQPGAAAAARRAARRRRSAARRWLGRAGAPARAAAGVASRALVDRRCGRCPRPWPRPGPPWRC